MKKARERGILFLLLLIINLVVVQTRLGSSVPIHPFVEPVEICDWVMDATVVYGFETS